MKRIVLILLLSFAYVAQAQYLAPMNAKNSGSWSVGLLRIDSSFNLRLFDTAVTKLAFPSNLNNRWARQGQRLYVYNGSFFELADNVPAIDTSSLSARINARVKYTDTAAMLVGYVRAARLNDTALAIRSAIPNVSGKVNYTDTSAMLSPYLRRADTTAMLSKYLRKADTTAMLLPYARKTLVNDTAAAIRAAIPNVSNKVNYSDTAAMLAPYYRTATATAALALKQNLTDTTTWDATKKNLADTALALRALIPSGTDTTSLSNRIDARVKYTDTAAMLAPYATDAQVALKLNIVDTANMRIRPIAGSNMTITGTYPNVTFAASGGTVIDTTSLSTRIDARVKYTDTASMLSPYLRSAAAATTYVPYTGATSNVNLGEFQATVGQVTLDQTPTQTAGVGVLRWNDSDGTADLGLKGGNVSLQIGQEEVVRVVNKTGANLLESQYHAVYVSGAQGQRLKVGNAIALADSSSAATIGLVTENIDLNQEGFITTNGLVRNINTTGSLQGETWNDGDLLYLSGTTAGQITNVKPIAPTHTVIIGYVVYAHAINGKIFVKVDNGYELDELHNVRIVSAANNEGLFYDSAAKLWENKSISTVLGYTPANNATVVKYADTAAMLTPYLRKVDTASLSTRINTKLNSADTASLSTRIEARVKYTDTATMLTPYLRKGDTATMLGGYLRKVDTASLSNRIDAKVGYGTLTTNYVPKATSTTAIGNSQIFDNGTSVGINTATPNATFKLDVNGQTRIQGKTTFVDGAITSSIQDYAGGGFGCLYLNNASPSTTNYSLLNGSNIFRLNTTYNQQQFAFNNIPKAYIFDDGGASFDGPVAINGAVKNSAYGLEVKKGSLGGIKTNGTLTVNGEFIYFTSATPTSTNWSLYHEAGDLLFNVETSKVFKYRVNNSEIARIFTNGNWGLGTTTDAGYKLDVNGTLRSTSSASFATTSGSVGIGTATPNASAELDIVSTTQGLGLPSMTTTQQNAIATPRTGLEIYNSTLTTPQFYNGSVWTGAWYKRGNAGTTAGTDFIGTSDGVDVVFKRNNVTSGWLNSTNSSFGVLSMPITVTSQNSVAFGVSALSDLTSGAGNSGFGRSALAGVTTGARNIGIGWLTGSKLSTSSDNIAIGYRALGDGGLGHTGSSNLAIGSNSMLFSTTATRNVVAGHQSGYNITTGQGNVALGWATLGGITTGTYNTAIGDQTSAGTVAANYNTSVGGRAAYYSTSGNYNTNIGYDASFNLTTGSNNTTLGGFAGQYLNASSNNVYLGYGAGNQFTHNAGDKNLLVGYNAFPAVFAGSNQLNLGNVLWGSGCSGTGQTAAGSLSIGVTAPDASALLDLTSTTKGLLLPRMTTTQINAIATPAAGLTVYNTTLALICFYNGTAWQKVTATAM